jgi:hypothetical protein
MMPMPPSLAILMAVFASVTVSIAALNRGMFMVIFRLSLVLTSTSLGRTLLAAGSNKTSSKVSAMGMSVFFLVIKKPSFSIELNLLKLSGKSPFYNSHIKKNIHPRFLAISLGV